MLTFRRQQRKALKTLASNPDFQFGFCLAIFDDFSPKPRDKISHGPSFAVNINFLSKNRFFSKVIRDKIRNGKHGFEIMHKNV